MGERVSPFKVVDICACTGHNCTFLQYRAAEDPNKLANDLGDLLEESSYDTVREHNSFTVEGGDGTTGVKHIIYRAIQSEDDCLPKRCEGQGVNTPNLPIIHAQEKKDSVFDSQMPLIPVPGASRIQ